MEPPPELYLHPMDFKQFKSLPVPLNLFSTFQPRSPQVVDYARFINPLYSDLLTTESRPHGSIAVHRGPLHYAYDIARSQKVLARNAQESRAVDLEFDATAPWQYAIDPATLKFSNKAPASGILPSPIFDAGQPPFTITATACRINWSTGGDTFAAPPPTNATCTGAQTTITLWPFGVSLHDHRAGIALT